MSFHVEIAWDEKDAPPFWNFYNSKPFASKQKTWNYVKRVLKRAELAQVQLHNIYVWNDTKRRCVWCFRDPRKFGDPWPTWN